MMIVWLTLTLAWAGLLVPSLLLWADSILWVIIMSWWANVAASAAAALSAYAEWMREKDNGSVR